MALLENTEDGGGVVLLELEDTVVEVLKVWDMLVGLLVEEVRELEVLEVRDDATRVVVLSYV